MSVARLHHVKKAAKDQGTCGSCHKPLPAGSAYLWWLPYFRSRFKSKRCMDVRCYPKRSELETSKAAAVYAAIEATENDINTATTTDDLMAVRDTIVDALQGVKDEYDEANENMGGSNSQMEELAAAYDYAITELENWDPDEYDEEDELSEEEWFEEQRASLQEAIDDIEYP